MSDLHTLEKLEGNLWKHFALFCGNIMFYLFLLEEMFFPTLNNGAGYALAQQICNDGMYSRCFQISQVMTT